MCVAGNLFESKTFGCQLRCNHASHTVEIDDRGPAPLRFGCRDIGSRERPPSSVEPVQSRSGSLTNERLGSHDPPGIQSLKHADIREFADSGIPTGEHLLYKTK